MSQFTAEEYQRALQALIPTGLAWPRDPGKGSGRGYSCFGFGVPT